MLRAGRCICSWRNMTWVHRMASLLERAREFAVPGGAAPGRGYWLRQSGEMRLSPAGSWLPYEAEQTFSADGLDFRWKARTYIRRRLPATIVDAVQKDRGVLSVRLFGVVPIAHYRGQALDKSEIMRALAEMPWRPNGFQVQPNLRWASVDGRILTAAFDNGQIRAAVDFEVDADGRVVRVDAPDRPRMKGGKLTETPWSGVFEDYRQFHGVRVPTRAEVTWHLPDGPFPCWRASVKEFRLF